MFGPARSSVKVGLVDAGEICTHADDAIDHGVADGDQAGDRAERDPIDQLWQEISWSRCLFPPNGASVPTPG
jgi:hypothetical protein